MERELSGGRRRRKTGLWKGRGKVLAGENSVSAHHVAGTSFQKREVLEPQHGFCLRNLKAIGCSLVFSGRSPVGPAAQMLIFILKFFRIEGSLANLRRVRQCMPVYCHLLSRNSPDAQSIILLICSQLDLEMCVSVCVCVFETHTDLWMIKPQSLLCPDQHLV